MNTNTKEKVMVLRVNDDLLSAIDRRAKQSRVSRSHIVRALLQEVFLNLSQPNFREVLS